MIISKNTDKATGKKSLNSVKKKKKVHCCGTEKGKCAGWRVVTLPRKPCLSWIAKNDSLNAQKGRLIPGRGSHT